MALLVLATPTRHVRAEDTAALPGQVAAAHRTAAPRVDGNLADWQGVAEAQEQRLDTAAQVLEARRDAWEGPADASVRFRLALHGDVLYLAAWIRDDTALHDPTAPWWHGDSLELFVDADRAQGVKPGAEYGPGCWQIFLMPRNPSLAWGVVYRGQASHFDDAGLRGVRVAHRETEGGYTLEAALPLDNFGLTGQEDTTLGFALALNDADDAPASPGTYLTWNGQSDLYRHPDRFGTLRWSGQATPEAAPPESPPSSWPLGMILAVALGLLGVLALAGPGARALQGIGPRPKWIALAATGVVALGIAGYARLSEDPETAALRATLESRLDEARTLHGAAVAGGALFEATPAARAASLRRLLEGEGIPARPGVEASALVPLFPGGTFDDDRPKRWRVDLGRPQRGPLPGTIDASQIALDVDVQRSDRTRTATPTLGTLALQGRDGHRAEVAVPWPAASTRLQGTTHRLTVDLPGSGPWVGWTWTPDAAPGEATLRTLQAVRDGALTRIPLPTWTDEGIPVLAAPDGPDLSRRLAPGESLRLALPDLLGGSDRLWLLVRSATAFPESLGEVPHAIVRIEHDVGDPVEIPLRNAVHLIAEAWPAGMQKPASLESRAAWISEDQQGVRTSRVALPIALDTARRPHSLYVANLAAGGAFDLMAATLVRTARGDPEAPVHVMLEANAPHDRMVLVGSEDAFRPWLGPSTPDAIRVEAELGEGRHATPLALSAPPPEAVARRDARIRTALWICLGVALLLVVLLAVDAADRLPRLSRRLAGAVMAAALVPLGVTLFVVDRTSTDRLGAEYGARLQRARVAVEGRLGDRLAEAARTAGRLAGRVAALPPDVELSQARQVVRRLGDAGLPGGTSGLAMLTGARLPPLRVPLGSAWAGLSGVRFLPRSPEEGFHASPWDGLVLQASARRGAPDRWIRVDLGLQATSGFLTQALGADLARDGAALVVLDPEGHELARAGPHAADLAAQARARMAADAARAGEGSPTATWEGQGRTWLASTWRLPAPQDEDARAPWMVLALDRAPMIVAQREGRQVLLALALFGLALVMTVAAVTARRVARPVLSLVDAAQAVQRGEFDVAVPEGGRDEVGQLAVAFDQMRRTLGHRLGDLDFLRRAQEVCARSLDLVTLHEALLDLFQEAGHTATVLLLAVESRGGDVHPVATRGHDRDLTDQPIRPTRGGGLGQALTGTSPILHTRAERAAAWAEESTAAQRLVAKHAAWIEVPLRAGEDLHGLVILGYAEPDAVPRPEARRLLAPLAGVAAAALRNARLYRLAALDEVTGLPGTTALEGALRTDVERARAGGPGAVLLRIGVDRGEHVSQRRGVDASRQLLRAVAEALAGIVGDRARLGRLREDEFGVRVPGLPLEGARALGERIRQRVASIQLPLEDGEGETLGTTVSVGIARAPEDAGSAEFVLHAAGRALAAARREGGDRVEDVARLDAGSVDLPPFEDGAIFRNERMVRVVEAARRAARSDASVLITGETGTGKEVIATLIHRRSARAQRPLVSVNCAAFPETLLESELFGHERGAFTGAERRREGRFEIADGGTLFLDEVAEMSPGAQVKLLRVLQERQFTRLGGSATITVDVRIVAATNQDLERSVADGTFREDLYYRLNVIRLSLPPLRDRREEIPLFVERFLSDFRRRTGGRGPEGLTPAAMDVLYRHPWPGNVRELKNVLERCAVLCEADQVGPEHLDLDVAASEVSALAPRGAPQDDLNPRQRSLLAYLARHGRATNKTYYEMTGTSPRTALRDLQDLMARGLVVRDGKRRGAVYRLPGS